MSVARVTEIIASSPDSFDGAIAEGIGRATKTLKNVTEAWVQSQKIAITDGRASEYRVILKVTFILKD